MTRAANCHHTRAFAVNRWIGANDSPTGKPSMRSVGRVCAECERFFPKPKAQA